MKQSDTGKSKYAVAVNAFKNMHLKKRRKCKIDIFMD